MVRWRVIELLPLCPSLFPRVFELESGEADYNDWLALVMSYANFGIYKDSEFVGYLGLQQAAPTTAEIHVSLERKRLHPTETRRIVIESGIHLFNKGVDLLTTVHLTTNRPACRLAKACGMPLEHLIIRAGLPHCNHTLKRETYLANPQQWEV